MKTDNTLRGTLSDIRSDLDELRGSRSKLKSVVPTFIFEPGFRALALWRLQIWANAHNFHKTAQLISNFNLAFNGAEFCVGAKIESPAIIRHPAGIVIGSGVSIGNHCILLQGITIGLSAVRNNNSAAYPVLGNNVIVGANSSILGNIRISDGTKIGAHSLVLKDTLSGTSYFGTPAEPYFDAEQES
jgi:serine O-acetyltransferase